MSKKAPINWATALFLLSSFLVAVIAVPAYIMQFGITTFDIVHFLVMAYATGLSITIGYHRLFAHRSFDAISPVGVLTGLFGAASFQNSILTWSSEHRYHHKYVDRDGFPFDPYNINKGFFYAHMGWLLRKFDPELPRTNVKDLEKSPFVVWQDRHILALMLGMGLALPTLVGAAWGLWVGMPLYQGALAGFIFGGVARIVWVQHATFFINSLCHYVGRRPYNSEQTARDSGIVAFFTYGEGYHNFHHTFQADYRNGIRPWHFDPGKWVIWLLSKVGWAWNLKRTPVESIKLAAVKEKRRRMERAYSFSLEDLRDQAGEMMASLEQNLEDLSRRARRLWAEYRKVQAQRSASRRARLRELRREMKALRREFMEQLHAWEGARMQALQHLAATA